MRMAKHNNNYSMYNIHKIYNNWCSIYSFDTCNLIHSTGCHYRNLHWGNAREYTGECSDQTLWHLQILACQVQFSCHWGFWRWRKALLWLAARHDRPALPLANRIGCYNSPPNEWPPPHQECSHPSRNPPSSPEHVFWRWALQTLQLFAIVFSYQHYRGMPPTVYFLHWVVQRKGRFRVVRVWIHIWNLLEWCTYGW